MNSKNRRIQYALFPLPPSSASSSSQGHPHGRTIRSSTPVSPAFSPHEPPKGPLPKLPDCPSPILHLRARHSREASNSSNGAGFTFPRFSFSSSSSRISSVTTTDYYSVREGNSASNRSSNDTLSPLPYLLEETTTHFQERHSRNSTIRPFEVKLTLPPSPVHFHEFDDLDSHTSAARYQEGCSNTPTLTLEPPLPIEEPRPSSPLSQGMPPKSPSVTSLQHYDELVEIALEATAEASSSSNEVPSRSTSAYTSRRGSTYSFVINDLPVPEDFENEERDMWEANSAWCSSSSEVSLALKECESRKSMPSFQKQSKIVFDDCSSSDEE